jgi:hypothetical protein
MKAILDSDATEQVGTRAAQLVDVRSRSCVESSYGSRQP